ncbi:MAG: NADH-quinone oxidoreductase subunit NuoE [Eubacteriales bacterium]|nr:NADH-quinone oxidoreductase subunit NuoE [Eubacteriales bacterium]MDY3333192.1 NADH-quinone oxidoreductase subunit NuoE [Gallibacter sp.]
MCNIKGGIDFSGLQQIIDKSDKKESSLIMILHETQNLYGYIPREAQGYIAQQLSIPASKVYGVVSFYSYFVDKPKGKYQVSVCMGTACYVKGAEDVLKRLEEELGIAFGETTEDLKFSIAQTRCLGDCSKAPVIMINDETYGMVTPDEVPLILNKYKEA